VTEQKDRRQSGGLGRSEDSYTKSLPYTIFLGYEGHIVHHHHGLERLYPGFGLANTISWSAVISPSSRTLHILSESEIKGNEVTI
jgi:hypothetical protein